MLRTIVALTLTTAKCPSDPEQCGCEDKAYTDYRGTINRTAGGYLCQKWSEQSPHKHWYNKPEDSPKEGLDENYCRNPNGWGSKPWCYTTDKLIRWAECDIPACGDTTTTTTSYAAPCDEAKDGKCGCYEDLGRSYRGTLAKSVLGFDCLPWAAQDPIYHTLHRPEDPANAQEDLIENYCRNPLKQDKGPWCYVDNTTNGYYTYWDYCDVEWCTSTTTTSCENMDPDNCGCRKDARRGYRGKLATTSKGFKCRAWNTQFPHTNKYRPDLRWLKDEGLDENYCRNPLGDDYGPWCYTEIESERFDYCDVPFCEDMQSSRVVFNLSSAPPKLDSDYVVNGGKGVFVGSAKNEITGNTWYTYRNENAQWLVKVNEKFEAQIDPVKADLSENVTNLLVQDVITIPVGGEKDWVAVVYVGGESSSEQNTHFAVYNEKGEKQWSNSLGDEGDGDKINASALYIAPSSGDDWQLGIVYNKIGGDSETNIMYSMFQGADGKEVGTTSIIEENTEDSGLGGMKVQPILGGMFAHGWMEKPGKFQIDYVAKTDKDKEPIEKQLTAKSNSELNGEVAWSWVAADISDSDETSADYGAANTLNVVMLDEPGTGIKYSRCIGAGTTNEKCSEPKHMVSENGKIFFPRITMYNGSVFVAWGSVDDGHVYGQWLHTSGSARGEKLRFGTIPRGDRLDSLTLTTSGDGQWIMMSGISKPSNQQFMYIGTQDKACEYPLNETTMQIVEFVHQDITDKVEDMEVTVTGEDGAIYEFENDVIKFAGSQLPHIYEVKAVDKQGKVYTENIQFPQCNSPTEAL